MDIDIDLAPLVGEFDGVGEEIQKDLLKAFLVRFDEVLFSEVVILNIHLYLLHVNLVFKHDEYLLDAFANVEN